MIERVSEDNFLLVSEKGDRKILFHRQTLHPNHGKTKGFVPI